MNPLETGKEAMPIAEQRLVRLTHEAADASPGVPRGTLRDKLRTT